MKDKISILVPTDFSSTCMNSLSHAIKLVGKIDSPVIYLLHVLSPDGSWSEKVEARDEAMKMLDSIEKSHYGVNIKTVLMTGDIFKIIDEVAVQYDVDMIVLGTHGKNGIQKIVGSNALKVVDSTTKPIMIVQADSVASDVNVIVFPLVLGTEDRQKAEVTAGLALATKSTVHIVCRNELDGMNKVKFNSMIIQLRVYFRQAGVSTVNDTSDGSNFDEYIIKYSTKVGANFIMMLTDSTFRIPFVSNKEEVFMFGNNNIPVVLVSEKKLKSSRFSVAG